MTVFQKSLAPPDVETFSTALFSQLMSVMGLQQHRWISRMLFPFLRFPCRHMSKLAVELDRDIDSIGWYAAISKFQGHFVNRVNVLGQENIPLQGPLMIISNHPAAYDIVVILGAICRDDVKIIHSDIALLQLLPHFAEHGIPVPYNIPYRLQTVRDTIRHLESGGAVLIFPRGNVEPDPAVSPGAEASLSGWSPSIELFLRRVPETKTVVAICSGMLSAKWYKNPLISLWKKYEQHQKVAEIFQIASIFITGRKSAAVPMVSFSTAFSVDDVVGQDAPNGELLAHITNTARQMLSEHSA